MRILVVDDNEANLYVIQNILKRAGYLDLLTFTSADAMFHYFQESSHVIGESLADVILMDIMMPEMDGIEACRLIQGSETLKDIPVIFVTALEDSNKVAEALDAGGMDYVMKPINKVELLARIRVALRLKEEKDWHKDQEEKIKTELDLATQVQMSVLSETLDLDHLLIKASYLPANKLAGDLYYWRKIEENRYAIIQLDMMGHGISASLVCMFISSVLRDLMRTDPDPDYVMQELNKWMNGLNKHNGQIPYYFTAIYLVLDTEEKTVEYVNAGHPPGIALIDEKEVIELPNNTYAIGFFEDIQIKKSTFTYTESMQLLLVTDGIVETIEDSGVLPCEYLKETSSFRWNSAAKIEPINMILSKEQQSLADDDMCAVLIQAN
ncbi:SpoIIE family protein phosphatase [Cytobacillus gottheilii]|uniref:SpoIIE family protein phosphatase n=1 Tax=Cytobacillus gottheilii TaxID=859144 RepID=UPI00083182E0|nr:fused response regulator/phosphatase [Cytobacillus gottheilii]